MSESEHSIVELLRRDRRYQLEAYAFVFDALAYAQDELNLGTVSRSLDVEPESDELEEQRHVTGQQLCNAIRHYALEQYGLMAKSVLNHWGIRNTSDFGEIVFNLIEIGRMRKTDQDRREDFDDVFDFNEGLCDSFRISLPDSSEESRS